MSSLSKRNFSAGEIAPALYGRTDQEKYANAARAMRNFIAMKHGGATNRAGTELCTATKADGAARLIAFVFSEASGQQYLVEFGDGYIRWVQEGAPVSVSGVAAWALATDYTVADLVVHGGVTYYCTAAHTSGAASEPGVGASWQSNWYALTGSVYEIPSPYRAADLDGLQVTQSADVMTIAHGRYQQRTLSRFSHTRWILAPITFGPAIASVTNLALAGGAAGTARFWAVTAIDEATGDEGVPAFVTAANKVPAIGTPTTVSWNPIGGARLYAVYYSVDGVTYGFLNYAGGTSLGRTDTTWGTPADSASTTTQGTTVASGTQAVNACVAAVTEKASDAKYTIRGRISVSSSALSDDSVIDGAVRAFYSRDGEPRVEVGIIATISNTFGGTKSESFIGTIDVPDNGYATLTIELVPEVTGVATDITTIFSCSVDESVGPDNVISWRGNGSSYVDNGSVVPDYTTTPPTFRTLFQSAADYPAVIGNYQQRRLYASLTSDVERVYGSRTGSPNNFSISSPLQDDDMVSFRLAGQRVNAVRHLVDVGRLLILSAQGIFVEGESEDDVLAPTNINVRRRLAHGSSTVAPIVAGNALVFVQARQSIVRDMMTNVVDGYKSNDLTLFASHLFRGYTIVDLAYAETPDSVVWAVRSDGVLLGMTYLREQEVWGWHRHDTDGVIERICVVPEGTEDAVYLVVRRTINGATRRFIERMASREIPDTRDRRDLFFVDAGLTYDGRNTDAALTMRLDGGITWDETETLSCTASDAFFAGGDVGNVIQFFDDDDALIASFTIETFGTALDVSGRVAASVPAALRSVATAAWARAVDTFTGLDHLEGKDVAVFGDGVVVASPNNPAYDLVTVTGGAITLTKPRGVTHVGLPYLCDLELLDIDTPSGPSYKAGMMNVHKVAILTEKSLPAFVGGALPTGDDPLEDMDQLKVRDEADGYEALSLRTGQMDVVIAGRWNTHGRVAIRQPDPAPITVLAVIPQGFIPAPA